MRFSGLLAGLAFLPACALAQQQSAAVPAGVRSAADVITRAGLRRDVDYLASDALRGRETPSPGLDSAAAYVIRRLTQLGLQPAGDSGTYRQHYAIRTLTIDTTASALEIAGKQLRYGSDFLIYNFSSAADLNAPLVYVSHGFRIPGKGIDPYAGLDVRGKILLADGPGALPRNETYESLGTLGVDWFLPHDEAQRRGALAVVYIPSARMLRLWERLHESESSTRYRELDPVVVSAYMAPRTPSVLVRPQMLEPLFQGEEHGLAELQARAARGDFAPSFALTPDKQVQLRLALAATALARPYNVVARLEGSDPTLKAEVITMAAHLDGAVDTEPVKGDSIYNAADDNASGSAGLLAIAEAMTRAPRPKRSVVFIWDTGEETGLWGTRYFVSQPMAPLSNIVLHINVDMIGRTKQPGSNAEGEEQLSGPNEVFVVGPRVLSTELDSLVEQTNRAYLNLRLNHRFDVANHEFFYPRTDASPFLERGIPTIDFFTGEHADYHMPSDEAQKLDAGKMEQVARTVFVLAWRIADAAVRPVLDKGIPASVPRYR